jgi:exopolysaccharide biosynthesis polyprenyl glycosylphosphotransferase
VIASAAKISVERLASVAVGSSVTLAATFSALGGGWGVLDCFGLTVAPIAALLVSAYYNDVFDLDQPTPPGASLRRIARIFGLTAALVLLLYAVAPWLRPNGSLVVSGAASLLATAPAIVIAQVWVGRSLGSRSSTERVLVLGSSPLAIRLLEELEARGSSLAWLVEKAFDPRVSPNLAFVPRGDLQSLSSTAREFRPNRVIMALAEARADEAMQQLLRLQARRVPIEVGPEAYERLTGKFALEHLHPSYLIFSRKFAASERSDRWARLVSIALAAVGLVLTLPLFPIVAIAIKLTSRGPVFFVQQRIGLDDKPFALYKFRTMTEYAGRTSEWVSDNAERVTAVGYWLRKYRVDELPQFWNILRGDMNLIGPRPHPVTNQQLFEREIPYYQMRSMIRPGLTGWAQTRHGYANDLKSEIEKMRFDLYYIANRSAWLDLRIFLDTVKTVLFDISHYAIAEPTIVDNAPASAARDSRPQPPPETVAAP